MTAAEVDAISQRIDEARRRVAAVEYPAAEAQWYTGGYSLPPVSPSRWRRVARWWFDVRCWIAEKILCVPVGDGW